MAQSTLEKVYTEEDNERRLSKEMQAVYEAERKFDAATDEYHARAAALGIRLCVDCGLPMASWDSSMRCDRGDCP